MPKATPLGEEFFGRNKERFRKPFLSKTLQQRNGIITKHHRKTSHTLNYGLNLHEDIGAELGTIYRIDGKLVAEREGHESELASAYHLHKMKGLADLFKRPAAILKPYIDWIERTKAHRSK